MLANITEFGATPLFTLDELRSAGVALALYPLSAFRAMNAAALNVYQAIRADGTQSTPCSTPCRRAPSSTTVLGYHAFEAEARRAVRRQKT